MLPVSSTCLRIGIGRPPALQWADVPAGTVQFALLVTDPQGITGTFSHWVVFGIPAADRGNEQGAAPVGSRQGLDSFFLPTWAPPCPPTGTHQYVFTLFALDSALHFVVPPTDAQVRAAMGGHVLASATLVATFRLLDV
jgi:hypothetical protein